MRLSLLFIILTIGQISFGQDIKTKKGNITVDGELMLTYTRDDFEVGKIFNLEKDLIIVISYKQAYEDFVEIYFVDQDIEFGSQKLSDYFFKGIVGRLIKDGVVNNDGSIDEKNMKIFIKTYD